MIKIKILRTIQIDDEVLRPGTECKADSPLAKKLEKLGYVKVLEKQKKQTKDKKEEDTTPKNKTKKRPVKKEAPKKKTKE